MLQRVRLLAFAAAMLLPALCEIAAYPEKPIRIIVPFALGATRQNFERLGAEVIKSTPEQFARRVQDDYAKWVRIRKETGIKLE